MSEGNSLFGRRPRQDNFDDLDPSEGFGEFDENSGGDDGDSNEEVDFDSPDFKSGDVWTDYAEDMDFEE